MKHLKKFNEDLQSQDYEEIVEEIKDILIDLKDEGFFTNSYYVDAVKYIYTSICRYDSNSSAPSITEKEAFYWYEIKDVINRLIVCFESSGFYYELMAVDKYNRVHKVKLTGSINDSIFYFYIICR